MRTKTIKIDGEAIEVAVHPTFDCYAADRNGGVYRQPVIRKKGLPRGSLLPRADHWEKATTFPVRAKHTPPYLKFRLTQNGVSKIVSVHRFILECWVGTRPRSVFCRHLDDDWLNNRLENLTYGSCSENVRDAFRNGGNYAEGARNGRARLTEEDVRRIRELYQQGIAAPDIRRDHYPTCSVETIRQAAKRVTWKHVT